MSLKALQKGGRLVEANDVAIGVRRAADIREESPYSTARVSTCQV
jgi:hypothetical protein